MPPAPESPFKPRSPFSPFSPFRPVPVEKEKDPVMVVDSHTNLVPTCVPWGRGKLLELPPVETRSVSSALVLSACCGDPTPLLGPLPPATGGEVTGTASTSPGTPCTNNEGQVLGRHQASHDLGHAGHSAPLITGILGSCLSATCGQQLTSTLPEGCSLPSIPLPKSPEACICPWRRGEG